MRQVTLRRGAIGVIVVGALLGGVAWKQMRQALPAGTIALGIDPQGVAVDPQLGRVFIANAGVGDGQTVSVLDTRTGQLVRTLTVGRGPDDVAVDARTHHLVVANGGYYDQTGQHAASIATFDARSGRLLHRIPVTGSPGSIRIDAATGHVVVPVYGARPGMTTIYELDARTGQALHTSSQYRAVLASDPRTGHRFVATRAGMAMLDARTGRVLRAIPIPTSVASALTPDAAVIDARTSRLFVADYAGNRVTIFDTRTGAPLRTVAVGQHPLRLAVDPRTARVFVVNQGYINGADQPSGAGGVSVLDARTGAVLRTVTLDLDAAAVALDERRGLALVSTTGPTGPPDNGPIRAGKVFALDARSGAIRQVFTVGVGPTHLADDARTGHAFVVNYLGQGGSYNGPQQWYLEWLPHHPPQGTVSMLNVTRLTSRA